MSRRGLLIGAGAAAVSAAGVAGVALRRRHIGRRDGDGTDLGSLRATPRTVRADDGVALHVEVDELPADAPAPAPGDPALVFVHGFALNLDCWHFQRAHVRGRYRAVFYDQRSHGRSGRSRKEHATIEQLGSDLERVLEAVVPDGPVVLVGHSMGGMTIVALAEEHPELFGERVVGVALLSTTAGGLKTHRIVAGAKAPDKVFGALAPRVVALLARGPRLVDGVRRAGSDVGLVVVDHFAFGDEVPPSYVAYVDQMLAQTPFSVLAEFLPSFDLLDKFAVLAAFERVPTLVLCGTEDRLTSIGHSRKMAQRMPHARLVEVDGAGHMAIMERHKVVDRALDDLLDQVAR